jgi:integrase
MKLWRETITRDGRTFKAWCADFTIRGVRHRPKEETKEDLDEVIETIRSRARQEKYGLPAERAVVTLAELTAARLADPNCKRAATFNACKRVLESFRDFFPDDQPVARLTTADLRDYFAKARGHLQPGTVNRELNYLGAMLNSAGLYFPALEHWKPPRLPRPRETEGRDRPLALDEARRIVGYLRAPARRRFDEHVRASVADIFQLALMTGMRQGEWRTRTWREIDFEAGTIRLTKTKTGKARTIVMSAPVRAILERRFAARGEGAFVFPGSYKGDRPMVEWTIRRQLMKAAESLGIPYGRKAEGGFTFHDARHTAVTNMLHDGHDLATVADISGHSKKTMALRYSHATAESRHRAMRSLEKFDFPESADKNSTTDSGAVEQDEQGKSVTGD